MREKKLSSNKSASDKDDHYKSTSVQASGAFKFTEEPPSELLLDLLHALLKDKSVLLASLNTDLCFTFYNQAYHNEVKNLTGKDIYIGMSILDVYDKLPKFQEISVDIWKRALKGEEIKQTQEFGDFDRYHRIYNVNVAPTRDATGKITGARSVSCDITDQMRAESALQESENRYASLFNSMSEGFTLNELIFDESGVPFDYRFLDVNTAFEQLTGITRAKVIGKTYNELFPNDSAFSTEQFEVISKTGTGIHFEKYAPILNRFFEVFAYSQSQGQFAAIFSDITDRKRAEETRDWLASFPEINPQIIAEVEFSGDITYINPAGKNLFPDFQGNMYQHPFLSNSEAIMDRLQRKKKDSIYRDVKVNDTWYKQTWIYLPEFDCVRIYSMDITDRIDAELALKESNAKLEETVKVRTEELRLMNAKLQQDITRRIQTEEALLKEQRKFQDVLEIIPVYLILLTPDHNVTFANRFFRSNFGSSHGLKCYEYLFNLSKPCENCESFKVLETKAPHRWEWTGPNSRIYDVHDFPLADIDGTDNILEMGIDITEIKQAQDRLRHMNTYNRSLIESNLDPLVTITPEGEIGDVNAATEIITGYSRDELIGTDFSSYFTDPSKARAGYLQVISTGSVRDYELEIHHKDGHITPVAYNASVMRDESGNIAGVFAGARDLTELKRTAHELESLNTALEEAIEQERNLHNQLVLTEKFAAMGRMLASITHEINNPLQTIKNCLFLIQDDSPLNSQTKEFLSMASSETERISNLVSQLREVYRPRQVGKTTTFSLPKLIDEVHSLLNVQLHDAHVQWLQGPAVEDHSMMIINGIEDQIKQVFINLSINAIEAMQPAGGRLLVDIIKNTDDHEMAVRLQDNGPGIAPDDLPKIFEPFFSRKSKGLGLGLAICYDIVQRHNGRVQVESQPGQGATFTIWFPLAESPEIYGVR